MHVKNCPQCGDQFETPLEFKNFCNRSCQVEFNRIKAIERRAKAKKKRGQKRIHKSIQDTTTPMTADEFENHQDPLLYLDGSVVGERSGQSSGIRTGRVAYKRDWQEFPLDVFLMGDDDDLDELLDGSLYERGLV